MESIFVAIVYYTKSILTKMVFSTWSDHFIDVILLGPGTTMEGLNGVGIRWDMAKKAKPWVLVLGLDQFAGGRLDGHSLRPTS